MKKILIANRADIARRIVKTAKKMRIETLQVYGLSDEKNSFIYDADDAVLLEGTTLQETYLNEDKIISIAKSFHVDAIHPGYGFLSETPSFAKKVAANGMIFIGPSAEVIALTGDKREAKKLAEKANVPTLPSLRLEANDLTTLTVFSAQHGFPLIIKAAFGGGGRGMRILHSLDEAKDFI